MIRTLFTDLGGVLLTNGWDRGARASAAKRFGLDVDDCDERHHLTFDTYEIGKISLEKYLGRVVFNVRRDFTIDDFRTFMYEQSQAIPEMIDFVKAMKSKHGFRVAAVSNEGPELAQYRIDTFGLTEFIDAFYVSGFLQTRKPDVEIFTTAIRSMQADPTESLYMDDRLLFVEVASSLGLNAIHHTSLETTRKAFAAYGIQ